MGTTHKDKLFAYTCPSCAGRLILIKDKANFICTSCGNTYDYEYFMGEDLLLNAKTACKQKEFNAAAQMYEFMLKKEPSNFEALAGLYLSRIRVSEISRFNADTYIEGPVYANLDEFKDKISGEQKKFFELAEENTEIAKEIKNRNAEINTIDKTLQDLKTKVAHQSHIIDGNYVEFHGRYEPMVIHPKTLLQNTVIITLVLILAFVIIGLFQSIPIVRTLSILLGGGFSFVTGLICFLSFLPLCLPKLKNIKEAEAEYKKLDEEIQKVRAPRESLDSDNKKDKTKIQENVRTMKQMLQ